MELWPETKLAIGPAIDEGFYYDLDLAQPISEADFPKIEAKMAEIKAKNLPFVKKEVSQKKYHEVQHSPFLIDETKKIFS